jgi:hypothetical protein
VSPLLGHDLDLPAGSVRVIEDYVHVTCGGRTSNGSGEKRGQSFDFDPDYLGKYVKGKVKWKL